MTTEQPNVIHTTQTKGRLLFRKDYVLGEEVNFGTTCFKVTGINGNDVEMTEVDLTQTIK